jgi:hypothetical protein
MRFFSIPSAGRIVVAFLLAAVPFAAAAAQPVAATAPEPAPLDADATAALGQALTFDPASLAAAAPAKPLRLPDLPAPAGLNVSSSDKPDGSANVAIKQPLPTDWDAKVGVDLSLAAPPPVSYQPNQPLPGSEGGSSSGAAWASMGVPNLASLDARIDPGSDQGRLGTTLQHSIPVGRDFSLTLRDSYALTGALGTSDPTAAAPPGLPVIALPHAAAGAATEPVWRNERGVKFDILPTGTTLAANFASASNDSVTHDTLSADQKLYGPLHVTTSVTDIGEPTINKKITAGLKLHW